MDAATTTGVGADRAPAGADAGMRARAADALRERRWADAADALARLTRHDAASFLQLRLARNLDALARLRPEAYGILLRAPARGRWGIMALPSGTLTVQSKTTGEPVNGPEPRAAAAQGLAAALPILGKAQPVALCGVADGTLLDALARTPAPPHGVPGFIPPIFLLEPDTELVTHALMLHDFTAPAGPIADPRFVWCIGDGFAAALLARFEANPFLPSPAALLGQGPHRDAITRAAEQTLDTLRKRDQANIAALRARYEGFTPNLLAAPGGPAPRALLVTSRYTTVLQHSTRDAADALDSLGYETRVVIEPDAHSGMPDAAIRSQVLDFMPDVVLTIDHLRRERADSFPPALPFVCWAQDDLPNLTDPAAGASFTPRDFLLTCVPQVYSRDFGYPAPQCLYLNKLTRVPRRGPDTIPARDVPDVTFVSNASEIPSRVAEVFLDDAKRNNPTLHAIASRAIARTTALYDAGGAMVCLAEARDTIRAAAEDVGVRFRHAHAAEQLAIWLFSRFNNLLYRQQALRWVADACRGLNLTLGLYGQGWEQNPDFHPMARGVIPYGPPLEELSRRAPVNLQIVPFSCLHQRLLDGLVADGFFLIRRHPFDSLMPGMYGFLERTVPDGTPDLATARAAMTPQQLRELDDHLARCRRLIDHFALDPVAHREYCKATGWEVYHTTPPRYDEVAFDSRAGVAALLRRFVTDPDAAARRRQVLAEQRAWVEKRFTYRAGFARIMSEVHALLTMKTST